MKAHSKMLNDLSFFGRTTKRGYLWHTTTHSHAHARTANKKGMTNCALNVPKLLVPSSNLGVPNLMMSPNKFGSLRLYKSKKIKAKPSIRVAALCCQKVASPFSLG